MSTGLFPMYNGLSLEAVTNKINDDYYKVIAQLNLEGARQVAMLRSSSLPVTDLSYLTLCDKLFSAIHKYIDGRLTLLVPYIAELVAKDAKGHDCSTCSGRCAMQHTTRVADFVAGVQSMKRTCYDIAVALLQECETDNEAFALLHKRILLLDTMLNELFCIEEQHLLPGIRGAQNNIHAHS